MLNSRDTPNDQLQPDPDSYIGQYIPGGFVERPKRFRREFDYVPSKRAINPKQLDYLRKIIRAVQDRGSRIVLVSQPLPDSTREKIVDYSAVNEQIKALAAGFDVPFYDFNQIFSMGDEQLYYDPHHFNQDGVELFNARLIEYLADKGHISLQSAG
jgi:lysophospholipase L1-like esterase